MTYEEMLVSDKAFLTPKDVAALMGCEAYSINVQAQQDPAKLGFPVCVTGTRVRIPRLGFLHWLTHGITRLSPEDAESLAKQIWQMTRSYEDEIRQYYEGMLLESGGAKA